MDARFDTSVMEAFGLPFLMLAALVIGQYVCVGLHEIGHLIAALANRWTPLVFRVGLGPRITLARLGDMHVELGANPFGGCVGAAPKTPALFRLKSFAFAIAGPAMTVGAILLLLKVISDPVWLAKTPAWLAAVVPFLILQQGICLINSILPHMVRVDGVDLPNDGKQAWASLTMKRSEVSVHFIGSLMSMAGTLMERGQDERARCVTEMATRSWGCTPLASRKYWIHLLLMRGRRGEAEAEVTRLLEDVPALDAKRSEVLDWLACFPLFYGYSELIEKSVAYIDEAIALEPGEITLKGTKGSLLIESGEHDRGLKLLQEVMEHTDSENDMAICSYYIALAHRLAGDWIKGRKLLGQAKEKYPSCIVRQRVTTLSHGN